MTCPAINEEPLQADLQRSANPAFRGYYYQAIQSLLAWVQLPNDSRLYLEGAEDIDVIGPGTSATTIQVRDTQAVLTLYSQKAREAIANFWKTTQANPNYRISYRYLTRSVAGQEQGNPFGAGVKGIDLWTRAASDASIAETLRQFLQRQAGWESSLSIFLTTSPVAVLQTQLFERVTWETKQLHHSDLVERINELLTLHGHGGCPEFCVNGG